MGINRISVSFERKWFSSHNPRDDVSVYVFIYMMRVQGRGQWEILSLPKQSLAWLYWGC